MTSVHWFILFQFAVIFDVIGWILALGIDVATFGVAGVILNLTAVMVFLTFALVWRNKGIGDFKFLTSMGKNFLVEGIPFAGTILPMWISFIYRARKSYIKSSGTSLAGIVAGASGQKIENKMAQA
ncbi:MAG: hypothetical protein UT05_C0003G0080 [Parcubacteria group bacterium GW2011_GWF2_38_76]|nr:MAG: hypothetical protein UT05_C0003G0080 [Parcubacteria group bacterium GW2011_GWF2_38_76]